jgi:hypothetical protein
MAKRKHKREPNAEYELPPTNGLRSDTIRVLSFDPGTKNFGISCVAAKNGKVKVVANSVLTNPMYDMTKFEVQKRLFLAEIQRWVELFQPNALIAERFMLRGVGTGQAMGELVPSMIALVSAYFNLNTLTIPAAQWKVPLQKRFDFDLKELYKQAAVAPHQLDASLIGVYGLEKGLKQKLNFTPDRLMIQVEDSSLLPLKNKRFR